MAVPLSIQEEVKNKFSVHATSFDTLVFSIPMTYARNMLEISSNAHAIMVLVFPVDNVFYAQEIAGLGKKEQYDPKTDFRKIQEIFTRINTGDLEQYKTIARRLIDSMKTDKDRIS